MSRRILTLALACALAGHALAAGEAPALQDTKDRESYVIGYQYGKNLQQQGVEVNPEVFAAGLRQAQEGKPSALTPEETQAVHKGLQMKVMTYRHQQYLQRAEKNLEANKAFFAENAKKEGVHTRPSGLQYSVLTEGTGPTPKETDTVTVHYRGTLLDGTEFDSSYAKGQPEMFDVNAVIPAWNEALKMMKVGSRWQLFVPSELAYGREEMGRIPANSALIFEVELLSIEPPDSGQGEQPPAAEAPAATPAK